VAEPSLSPAGCPGIPPLRTSGSGVGHRISVDRAAWDSSRAKGRENLRVYTDNAHLGLDFAGAQLDLSHRYTGPIRPAQTERLSASSKLVFDSAGVCSRLSSLLPPTRRAAGLATWLQLVPTRCEPRRTTKPAVPANSVDCHRWFSRAPITIVFPS